MNQRIREEGLNVGWNDEVTLTLTRATATRLSAHILALPEEEYLPFAPLSRALDDFITRVGAKGNL